MANTPRQVSRASGVALGVRKPLCAYLRLTEDRDGNKIGYDVQIAGIEAWARRTDNTIGAWYKDRDITAADMNKERPEYERMLQDVETGMWGGIATWRPDRLIRLPYELERCIYITEKVGAYIVSIEPELDARIPLHKSFLRSMINMAEMEIVGMKVRAKGHRQERALRGMYNGGGPRPYGFEGAIREDPDDDQSPIINRGFIGIRQVPEEVERLQAAAKRIAWEGVGWGDVIAEWHSEDPPAYGATNKPWAVWTLQRVLTGPRIVGKREAATEDPETGELITRLVDALWDAVIDEKTWEKLKSLLNHAGSRGGKRKYLLTGLLRCGRCGREMTGARRRYPKQGVMTETPTYRCKSGPEDKAKGSCGSLNVIADPVEKFVIAAVLAELKESPKFVHALTEDSDVDQGELAEAMEVISECNEALEGIVRTAIRERWSEGERKAAREEYVSMRDEAQRAVDRVSRRLAIPLPTPEDRTNLQAWFEGLTFTQQRALLRAGVRVATVRPTGRSGPKFDLGRLMVALTNGHEVDGSSQDALVGEADR